MKDWQGSPYTYNGIQVVALAYKMGVSYESRTPVADLQAKLGKHKFIQTLKEKGLWIKQEET